MNSYRFVRSTISIFVAVVFSLLASAAQAETVAPDAAPTSTIPKSAEPKMVCGASPSDWCSAPAGDPCGAHTNPADCKKDIKCEGLPYVGESVVACEYDQRCFATNCPTVGCVSICENLDQTTCEKTAERCEYKDGKCGRKFPCPKKYIAPDSESAKNLR